MTASPTVQQTFNVIGSRVASTTNKTTLSKCRYSDIKHWVRLSECPRNRNCCWPTSIKPFVGITSPIVYSKNSTSNTRAAKTRME